MTFRPDINPQIFIEYLLRITSSDNFVDLSLKIPRSASHINDVYNMKSPLSFKFVTENLNYINKSLNDYDEWLSCNSQVDTGKINTKKQRRNDFDQIDFINFMEKLIFIKTNLKRRDIIESIGISEALYNNILREQRILSDETLFKINSVFGINENSYQIYLIDPDMMIHNISSRQLEKLSKNKPS